MTSTLQKTGLPVGYINALTPYLGSEIDRVHRLIETQGAGAVQALGARVIAVPDASSWQVTAGTGLSVLVSTGMGIAPHSTFGAVLMQSVASFTLSALTASSTLYIYAAVQNDATNDSRTSGVPQFVFSSSSVLANALLLATVTTGATTVSGVVDNRDFGELATQRKILDAINFFAEDTANVSGLTWAYKLGRILGTGGVINKAAGTVTLTASATNYVEIDNAATVSVNTTTFTAGRKPIRVLVTNATGIVSSTDARVGFDFTGTGGGGSGGGYGGTSTTSLVIQTGSSTFTTQAGFAYQAGARVRAINTANTAQYMEGVVTAYSTTTLTINVDTIAGSGTVATWAFNIAGNVGANGIAGASLNPRGQWATATAYAINDDVQNGVRVSSYKCYAAHTSSATTEPGVGATWATFWTRYAQAGDTGANGITPRGAHNVATAYVLNDVVTFNGAAWRALAANTNVTPVEGANWTLFVDKGGAGTNGTNGLNGMRYLGQWSNVTAYIIQDGVTNNGSTYIAKLAHTNQEPPNATYWDVAAARGIDGAGDGAGNLSKSVAGGANVTLSASEAVNGNIDFTGALTANINVIVPTTPHGFYVKNSTTGAFTLTVKTASGTGVSVAQGATVLLGADGVNVVVAGSSSGRVLLTAARTYYVSTTGSDSANGLAVGTPFLTVQKAIDVISGTLDLGSFVVTVQIADGTYTANITLKALVGGSVTIQGNVATPANVVLTASSGNTMTAVGIGVNYKLQSFKANNTGGNVIVASDLAVLTVGAVEFGVSAATHIWVLNGALVNCAAYKITGGGTNHAKAQAGGAIVMSNITVTITGTPAFSDRFIVGYAAGLFDLYLVTFSGAVTAVGNVYGSALSCINTYGNFGIPGGGSTILSGSQYV